MLEHSFNATNNYNRSQRTIKKIRRDKNNYMMYDEEYESEIIEQEFDDTGVIYEKPIELDIFAEDAWDDSALLAAFHKSLSMHPEANAAKYDTKGGKTTYESTPLSVRTTVSPSSSNTENRRGRRSHKYQTKDNNININMNNNSSKKNDYNKKHNYDGSNNNNYGISSLENNESLRQSAFPENNNFHKLRSPSASQHQYNEQQYEQEQYRQRFGGRAMHQSPLSPPPMPSQQRTMHQLPLSPPPMQIQQQQEIRNQYYQDHAHRAAADFHNNNYYNTSPTYMYQHQQRFPQRMYEQVPSPPPQQQPYHPIHLNKELADLLLSWYRSGYQAGRYHALREMNSSRANAYNYADHYGRNSPVSSNMNSGSPYQQQR